MELIADEDIPRPIVEKLRSYNIDILYIEEENKGITDTEVLKLSDNTGRMIITFDRDFTELDGAHSGIIHITSRRKYEKVVDSVKEFLDTLEDIDTENTLFRVYP